MDDQLDIPVSRLPDATVTVAPTGEIDFARVRPLRDALVHAATLPQTRRVVVDLRDVTLIDSTGLGALIAGLKAATDNGVSYQVCNANPFIYQTLAITGLVTILNYALSEQDRV
jgi:anti-anti-sigma factor